MKKKRIAILGSTGSIGRQGLEVIARHEHLSVCGLAAGSSWEDLLEQARSFEVQHVALADGACADQLQRELDDSAVCYTGSDAMSEMIRACRPDIVLSGIVGAAGLAPTLTAIECGADLAIANKETLVMAGEIVLPAAQKADVALLPVDSEHSAIFQCLASGRDREVDRVIITSSGGALRDWSDEDAARATVDDALNHPTWSMGPKITIDSATLMNKTLEMIEAHWLFGLPSEKIEVVIHPESIVHSLVEFRDGSVLAQLGHPDMMLPIAYALSYPERPARDFRRLDLAELGKLHFRSVEGRFRSAIRLGYEVIDRGGLSGAVVNGANEAAVQAFLERKIPFGKIAGLVEETLNHADTDREVTLQSLIDADAWARGFVLRQVGSQPQHN
ncbi:MAG: 1-deoxy-D-xylulose-5-phosphate reductoisomerase [Phycisphaerae bacterium]